MVEESRLSVLENEVDNIKEDVREIKNNSGDMGVAIVAIQKTMERLTVIIENQQQIDKENKIENEKLHKDIDAIKAHQNRVAGACGVVAVLASVIIQKMIKMVH